MQDQRHQLGMSLVPIIAIHELKLFTNVLHELTCPGHGRRVDQDGILVSDIGYTGLVNECLYMRGAMVSRHNVGLRESYA